MLRRPRTSYPIPQHVTQCAATARRIGRNHWGLRAAGENPLSKYRYGREARSKTRVVWVVGCSRRTDLAARTPSGHETRPSRFVNLAARPLARLPPKALTA